jgi:hypothetical protein
MGMLKDASKRLFTCILLFVSGGCTEVRYSSLPVARYMLLKYPRHPTLRLHITPGMVTMIYDSSDLVDLIKMQDQDDRIDQLIRRLP